MFHDIENVLVLAPHTDDGELGLGGTINKLILAGNKVTYVAFSTAEESVPEGFPKDILKTEVRNATLQLGIKPDDLIIFNYQVRKLNYVSFDTQCFVRLSQENIDVKIRALKEYHSQGKRNYLSEEFVYSLARARGVQVGCEFAEAFEVVRLFL